MKEDKRRFSKDESQMDEMIRILSKVEKHLGTLVYYQQPSRGFAAELDPAMAQPYITENKELRSKIKALVIEELKKLNEENK
jgi:hypothetical protein